MILVYQYTCLDRPTEWVTGLNSYRGGSVRKSALGGLMAQGNSHLFLLRQLLVFAVAKARPDASGCRPSGHHPPRLARGIKDLTEHSMLSCQYIVNINHVLQNRYRFLSEAPTAISSIIRRGWDSNPGSPKGQRFSRPPRSTTLAPLLKRKPAPK
jgi:hypothetical protein